MSDQLTGTGTEAPWSSGQGLAARHNLKTVLLRPRSKIPATKPWTIVEPSQAPDVTHDGNYGVVLDGDLVILDCDPRNGGPSTLEELEQVAGPVGLSPLVVKTGGGGLHVYLRGQAQTCTPWPGVEVKAAGNGKQRHVVGPGCIHPDTGEAYEVISEPAQIGFMHPELSQRIMRAKGERPQAASGESVDPLTAPPTPKGGDGIWEGRDHRITAVAGAYLRRGDMEKTRLRWLLLNANEFMCEPPMDGDQVEKIATSAFDGFERGNSFAEDQEHLDLAGDLIAGLRQGEEPTLDQFVGLGTALAGLSDTVQTIWGSDDIVLWADGECCLITAPTGHGKTTLAQNVLLAMTPLRSSEVLGHEVRQLAEDEFILYLAADRPDQILRSFARMVEPDDYAALDETILVRKGPPEAMIVKDQKQYVKMISKAEEATGKRCAVLVVDSLKDMAPATSEDATGSALNIARQYVVATGRQVLELHHQRKKQQGGGPPNTIDDVFGSSHIVNGAGTVLLIWASETTGLVDRLPVEVKTLKKPMAPFRCQAVIDAPSGTITPTDDRSAKDLFVGPTASVTAEQVARHLGVTTKTAQRRLRDLVTEGFAREVPGSKGGAGGSSAITWVRDTSKGVK